MIELTQDICSDFDRASAREWLETNGIGGYAASTVSGANSRRYHGLLVAAAKPPLGRAVLLSKFDETIVIDGARYDLSCNQYPGSVYPEGYKYLTGFRLDPFPVWTFDVNGIEIEKSIFMVNGENTTVCRWTIEKRSAVRGQQLALELRPLLAFRDHHHLRHEDAAFDTKFSVDETVISFTPYAEMPTLYLANNAASVEPNGEWYRNFEYAIERERGFDYTEDLFQPCSLRFDLSKTAAVIASTESWSVSRADSARKAEMKRRASLVAKSGITDKFSRQLILAADQFIVNRGTGKTVIAGYPWFSDWGRDTMIALNGLTLATNRPEIAKSILTEFSKHISEGMIPNRFPDAGETPEYNTVDATMWYFEAIRAYLEKTADYEFVRKTLFDKLINVIDWHVAGTRYQIHVAPDGLLYSGEPGVQLTWMDAKIGDWVVTPRTGKAVEIQALWYNALCVMADLAERFEDKNGNIKYLSMAATAKISFNQQFWNDDEKCLYDVVATEEKDGSIRPNQIFAVSLPHSMLNAAHSRAVVDKVETELLTPVGLRSLSPHDTRYVPIYIGSPLERDAAYHQGTVWGWLIGPFVDAYRKVHESDLDVNQRVSEILAGFEYPLSQAAPGQIAEIFDGDAPHLPRGCPAQAWSVAELLRVK